jgi:hypothetical protein
MIFDVLVVWCTGWEKPHLTQHSRWHRGLSAGTLTEACNQALTRHPSVWNPQVSMCWPQYPQPKKAPA